MSNIKGYVTELKSLKNEIKVQQSSLKVLRQKAKQVEESIQEYLESKGQTGLKYKGMAIMVDHKEKRRRKKKQEQLEDSLSVLSRYDIDNPQRLLDDLMDARKGSPEPRKKLKFQTYKE
jgi:hypothetical protein